MRKEALPLVHVVSAMSGSAGELWGKERVIATLMRAQRDSGEVHPRLVTFGPCALGEFLAAQGFDVEALDTRDRTVPFSAMLALRRSLSQRAPAIVHTHGYKANIVGRVARVSGAPMRGLISTCHGWVDETSRTRLYNRIDRVTAPASDFVTVTDETMLSRISRRVRAQYVANGITDRVAVPRAARIAARERFGFPADRLVVGTLGRIEPAKGIGEVVEAARRTTALPVHWVIAGSGPLEHDIREACPPNVTVLGYVPNNDGYLDALDIYLQASHAEGLSLALLEAMRAALPIVATRVGSTDAVLRSESEALLVAPRDVDAIIAAVRRLSEQPDFAARLAASARERFERGFHVRQQHEAFLKIYRSCDRMRA